MIVDPYLILAGAGIGFVIAAPIGPVNILCIQSVLERGFRAGIAVGLGAVLGDGLIALAAASGVTVIAGFMKTYLVQILLLGGLVVTMFGLRLFTAAPESERAEKEAESLLQHGHVIPQTFLLTVTNPGAILGIFALFGGVASAFGSISSYVEAFLVVGALMFGNFMWWFGLSLFISVIRHRIGENQLRLINRGAGIVLISFGGILIGRGVLSM